MARDPVRTQLLSLLDAARAAHRAGDAGALEHLLGRMRDAVSLGVEPGLNQARGVG